MNSDKRPPASGREREAGEDSKCQCSNSILAKHFMWCGNLFDRKSAYFEIFDGQAKVLLVNSLTS